MTVLLRPFVASIGAGAKRHRPTRLVVVAGSLTDGLATSARAATGPYFGPHQAPSADDHRKRGPEGR